MDTETMASVESCFLEALLQYRTRVSQLLSGSSSQYRTLVSNTQEKKTEYGYLQVDNFRSKWSHLKEALPEDAKHWVALPEGIVVHSYPKDASSPFCDVVPVSCMKKPQQPSCSRTIKQLPDKQCEDAACTEEMCIHQSLGDTNTCKTTMKTSCTSLPNNTMRQVRFCDGICKGSDIVPALSSSCPGKQEQESELAQWIYIDRDICGFSLENYAPDDVEYRDFASSHYGQAFCADLKALESVCQQASCNNTAVKGVHDKEEKLLDKALESAKLRASFYSLASPCKARRPFYFHPQGCSKSQRHPGQ
jgi:hypothetical protein